MTRIEEGKGGGICLAQDPRAAEMSYMPLNAIRYDDVSRVFLIPDLASALIGLTKGKAVGIGRKEGGSSEKT